MPEGHTSFTITFRARCDSADCDFDSGDCPNQTQLDAACEAHHQTAAHLEHEIFDLLNSPPPTRSPDDQDPSDQP